MRDRWVLSILGILVLAGPAGAERLAVISERAAGECLQYAPAFSFDSRYLAWVEQRQPVDDSYVQVMELGSGKTRRVPEQGRAEAFCWWSEGNVLAYVDSCWPWRHRRATLFTFDLDLGTVSEIPLGMAAAQHLIWTCDGIQFVLLEARTQQALPAWHLARVVPEEKQVEFLAGPMHGARIAGQAGELTLTFAWSPDANAAAAVDVLEGSFLDTWERGLPGMVPDNYLPGLNATASDPPCLAVGPEGKELFFAAQPVGDPVATAVWRYRPDELEAEPILDFPLGEETPVAMAVSQTGDRLAILSVVSDPAETSGAILRVTGLGDAPAWAEREIWIDGDLLEPRAWPPRRPTMSWSPDGGWLGYSIGGQVRLADVGTELHLCISHLKQLALACLMFTTDFDDALPGLEHVNWARERSPDFRPAKETDWWAAVIYPYVRNESMMRCPLMGEGEGSGYVYPEHLWGKMVREIQNPSKTILLMDSAPRHEGKRVVAFADGHVEVVAEEDVGRLLKGK